MARSLGKGSRVSIPYSAEVEVEELSMASDLPGWFLCDAIDFVSCVRIRGNQAQQDDDALWPYVGPKLALNKWTTMHEDPTKVLRGNCFDHAFFRQENGWQLGRKSRWESSAQLYMTSACNLPNRGKLSSRARGLAWSHD